VELRKVAPRRKRASPVDGQPYVRGRHLARVPSDKRRVRSRRCDSRFDGFNGAAGTGTCGWECRNAASGARTARWRRSAPARVPHVSSATAKTYAAGQQGGPASTRGRAAAWSERDWVLRGTNGILGTGLGQPRTNQIGALFCQARHRVKRVHNARAAADFLRQRFLQTPRQCHWWDCAAQTLLYPSVLWLQSTGSDGLIGLEKRSSLVAHHCRSA
jgi:hypothetical protein